MGTQMRSRAREDVIVEQFPKRGRAGRATSDVIATSRGQVNSRARSTTQQSAASTRDLTRTLRADNYLRKPSRTLFLPDVGRSAACPVNSRVPKFRSRSVSSPRRTLLENSRATLDARAPGPTSLKCWKSQYICG